LSSEPHINPYFLLPPEPTLLNPLFSTHSSQLTLLNPLFSTHSSQPTLLNPLFSTHSSQLTLLNPLFSTHSSQLTFLLQAKIMSSPGGAGGCAHCKKLATTRCIGCLGAPIYDQIIITSTFYCSKDCQVADRQRHKSECRKLQARKSHARAAQLLQAIFYQIRSHAYPKQMDTAIFNYIYVEGLTIFLDSVLTSGSPQQPPTLRLFPISFNS
jgi:hypothetical protein